MRHNDDAFATMLLTCRIAADRDELARPLGAQEYHRLEQDARRAGLPGLGGLIGADVSRLKMALDLPEQDAYRLAVLLNRAMPLSYALERYAEAGIEIVTEGERCYPARLTERLGDKAPPMLYACGDLGILGKPALALIGAGGRCDAEELLTRLCARAHEADLTVLTGDEPGVGRAAERLVGRGGGRYAAFMAGELAERMYQPGISELIAGGRGLALSIEHPDAAYTRAHALERNRCLHALSLMSVVVSGGPERGATLESAAAALRGGWAEAVYVWNGCNQAGNPALRQRGASGFDDADALPIADLARRAALPRYQQLSML
ncbi:MAG: hypothetical protein GX558_06850 [Clostridiales bacterium]|nr:hypothetical protein [Clostridiales bacterium]